MANQKLKNEALDVLEEANDLIVEAKYLIEGIIPKYNILSLKNKEILNSIVELIKILSEVKYHCGANKDMPIEAVYKMLYLDHQKVRDENKELKKDIVRFMNENGIEKDVAVMNLKIAHYERDIESLNKIIISKDNRIITLEEKLRSLKKKVKENNTEYSME